MADQHIGYPGSVNASQLASWMPNVAAAQYSVEGLFDGQVVTNAIGSRGVTVKPGIIIGDGIMDVFESNTTLNLGAVSAGSPDRWDMVVLRRTWSATPGASTSIYTIIPGGPNKTLPARNNNKGVLSDQPMALCRVKAGSSDVQEIIDLRVWASNGGVTAVHDLVMTYLDQIGTHLTINGNVWVKNVAANGGSTYWTLSGGANRVMLGGVGASLSGSVSAGGGLYSIQGGTVVQKSDGSGYARITWPRPFANGVLTVVAMDGDDWAGGGSCMFAGAGRSDVFGASGYGSKTDWVYAVKNQPMSDDGIGTARIARVANFWHRINYIVIGF